MTIFKNNGISVTVKPNLKTAEFLDIYFDLVKEIYQSYKKPNDDTLIHQQKIQLSKINTVTTSKINLKKFQKFHQMNPFLTIQFLITKCLEKEWI